MTLPNFFYAEPRFRTASKDPAKLKMVPQKEWTLDTPGLSFGLALDYYRVEAFVTKTDRDAACGPTAHKDVRYAPAFGRSLMRGDITMDHIACGYTIDHPLFEDVFDPIFEAALRRLIGDVLAASDDQAGTVASAAITIARVRYTISAVSAGDWIEFPVKGLAALKEADQDLMQRTIAYLGERLILHLSPALIGAKPS